MALTDPQTITISGNAWALARTSVERNASEYQSIDGLIKLKASHAYGRRKRRVIRIDHSKVTADPFIPTQNRSVSMSNYVVFDLPEFGYTTAEALAIHLGFSAYLSANSSSVVSKVLGGES